MNHGLISILVGLVLNQTFVGVAPIAAPVGTAVNHPLLATDAVRSQAVWRRGVEQFGEGLARHSLELRGYEVLNAKLAGNKGIDLIAIKRDGTGALSDVRLVEVKTHYGSGKPRLGQTQHGLQTSRTWFADRLERLRSEGPEGRRLALEVSRFRKSTGKPLERLGEVNDVNLSSLRQTIRDPVTQSERSGPVSIPRLLNQIAEKVPEERPWAMRHLARADLIRETSMGVWLATNPQSRALERATASRLTELETKQALRGSGRVLARVAGRGAVVVAVLMDGYEIYGHVRDYRAGNLSRQEFVIALARSGGGIAGAWAGAEGGAIVGAWIGGFGGPLAWITVPAGAALGGTAGGIGGYFGGRCLGEAGARAWYGSLDRDVKLRVDEWIEATPKPQSE
jgi:Holliday junction resolvase-like predicted endonuclease